MAFLPKGIGNNNNISGPGTITCPAGSYVTGTNGKSDGSIDYIDSLNCRNIYTGQTSTTSGGSFGNSGRGKASGAPIACNGTDGLTGFHLASNNRNLDWMAGYCRTAACGGGGCGSSTYRIGWNGGGNGNGSNAYIADGSHLVSSVSGARSGDGVVADFNFSVLNFDTIAGYPGKYLQQGAACCAGQDGSAECSNARAGGLNCQSVLQNWCSQGDRIYSDGTCQTAAGNGSLDGTWARNQQLAWCQQGSNFNTDNCKNFCTASTGNTSAQKEACNTLYSTQCSQTANKGLDVCTCSLPWSDYPADITAGIDKITGAPHEPMCYFSQCAQKGYLKTTKDKLACPGCIQSQNIDITNSTASLKNISQSCNVSTSTGTTAAAATTAASSTPSGGTTTATSSAASVTPAAAVTTTPATSTATASAATAAKAGSPLIFIGAGAAAFCLMTVVAIAATKR